ncbi:MAG: PEP-CTERM sorting domain-containing protein [Burkholderiales bacterium]|nr:PEP-CTERM sorting domain-containing protein [Burkholderiales bacterium]
MLALLCAQAWPYEMRVERDTAHRRVGYEELIGAGRFTMGYRFAASDAFVSPLPAIESNVSMGHWDIGTALAVPEPGMPLLFALGAAAIFARRALPMASATAR